MSDTTGKEKRGGGGGRPEGVKERAVHEEIWGGHTEGPRKTNSSLRCHYLHKSDVCVFFLLKYLPGSWSFKGTCGNWLKGGRREEEG